MAMITPIGATRNAFDATENAVFSFTSSGGNQVVANELKIYNNETSELVYSNRVETYAFNQTVSANTLENGVVYNFTFTTYDVDDNASEPSSPLLFYCYTNPTFEFTNITENQRISNSSYEFQLRYSQSEGELINFVTYYLYDSNNVLLSQSDDIYNSSSESTVDFSYMFSGLDNDTTYYIQAKGLTLNGFSLSTELIRFSVRYEYPTVFANLEAKNLCNEGYNQIRCNITLLDGVYYPTDEQPIYIDNMMLDLNDITRKRKVSWTSKTLVTEDFGLQIWYKIGLTGKQFKLTNVDNENTYLLGEFVREIPFGYTTVQDYVRITGYVDGVEKFYIHSNYVNMVNNTSYLILNFKYAPSTDTYSLILNVYDQEDNYTNWKHYAPLTNDLVTNEDDYIVDNISRIIGETYGYAIDPNYVSIEERPIATNNEDDIVTNEDDNICALLAGKSSNIDYNILTNLLYGNTMNIVGQKKDQHFEMGADIFPIGNITLENGIYDHFDVYRDYNRDYTTEYTNWNYNTYMLCNFNGNINGGSVGYLLDLIQSIRIKAREIGTYNYITLFDKPTNHESDLSFVYNDYRVPNGANMEYALVPVQNGGIEGQYITTTTETKWRKLFVSDDTMTLSLIGNVSLGDIKRNSPSGTLQPIDNIYPIVVRNGNVNYNSGSVSGILLCDDYSKIDRAEIVKLRDTWCNFLLNGKAKVIKDWNGNIFVCQIIGEPTVSLRQNFGNGIGDISFSFVEQGKWDNQQDLYETGIVDIVV